MRITPRKEEYKAVADLLESDAYDSADALAKEIVKTVYELLLERDWYALLFRFSSGDPTLAWGPFSSDNEAEKYARNLTLPGPSQLGVLKVYSPARQLRTDAEAQKSAEPVYCLTCGHPAGLHEHAGANDLCQMRGCKCKRMARERKAA